MSRSELSASRRSIWRIAALSAVLFLSGGSALLFETLWLRLAGLTFGNSVWSAALILSSFMAGLALGNTVAARSTIRRWRPLRVYAALELAVAIFGCTIAFALPLLGQWLRPLFQLLWAHQAVLIALRLMLSFVMLIIPTTAMGLTLPVLIGDPLLRRMRFGRVLGLFYGWNTLGAVAGACVGEAYLIEAVGLHGTALVAGLGNFAAALAALFLSSGHRGAALAEPSSARVRPAPFQSRWRLLTVSLASGAILLCLEVVWFRFLRLYVASSSRSFAAMLAVVLAGIGVGGLLSSALPTRMMSRKEMLPILFLLGAIAAPACYVLFPAQIVQSNTGRFFFDSWWQVGQLALALMFPAAVVSGMVFPLIAARLQTQVGDRTNSTGMATLFNTIGAAVGPLAASFVLLPAIGFQSTLLLCAGGYAVAAVLASERQTWSLSRWSGWLMLALTGGIVAMFGFFPYHRDEVHFASARSTYDIDEAGNAGAKLVRKLEGTSDTIQLLRHDLFGRPYYYQLLTNAFSMSATNAYGRRYMRLFAYLPLALRPNPTDGLLICYGCGVTADALVHIRSLEHIDIVDISKEVLGLADAYVGVGLTNPLRDPRVTSYVQDGRFFLQASPRQYDIITGEPPPPKVAGSVSLYTEEFFGLMRDRLKNGGVATFWLPVNQLKVEESKAILRAFHNAFANASVWASPDDDWVMMGIKGTPARPKAEDIRRLWDDSGIGPQLVRMGIETPAQLGALYLMDGDEIERMATGTAPLTDFFPKRLSDERWDEKASAHFAADYMEASSAAHRFNRSPLIEKIWPDSLKPPDLFFTVRETRYLSSVIGSNKLAELDFYLRSSRLRIPVLETLGSNELRYPIAEEVAREAGVPPEETVRDLVAGAVARRDIAAAIDLLEKQNGDGSGDANTRFLLMYLYCLHGRVDKAEALAAAHAGSIGKDWFVDWLWTKLNRDFGFRPPS